MLTIRYVSILFCILCGAWQFRTTLRGFMTFSIFSDGVSDFFDHFMDSVVIPWGVVSVVVSFSVAVIGA